MNEDKPKVNLITIPILLFPRQIADICFECATHFYSGTGDITPGKVDQWFADNYIQSFAPPAPPRSEQEGDENEIP